MAVLPLLNVKEPIAVTLFKTIEMARLLPSSTATSVYVVPDLVTFALLLLNGNPFRLSKPSEPVTTTVDYELAGTSSLLLQA